jgi:23S rRNA maturation-related 3'-5' exoribonuclease YhaM
MIRSITGGNGITVSGSVYSAPYIDNSRASAGMVRYNSGNVEVYDGSSWVTMQSGYPTIELDGVTQEAIQWVKRKMIEEKRMLELAKTHPAVADALAAQQRAEEAVRIAVALCDVQ